MCSAVRKNGQSCQSWAVIDSEPPLCPAHAGMQKGAGAPKGNRNALKHGLYAAALQPEDVEEFDIVKSSTLVHELVLARAGLRRLSRCLDKEEVSLAELQTILPLMSMMIRTVIRLRNNIDDSFDWDEVLDDLGAAWGMDL